MKPEFLFIIAMPILFFFGLWLGLTTAPSAHYVDPYPVATGIKVP